MRSRWRGMFQNRNGRLAQWIPHAWVYPRQTAGMQYGRGKWGASCHAPDDAPSSGVSTWFVCAVPILFGPVEG